MNQLFQVTINGTIEEVDNANISELVNRFYDVAMFELDYDPSLESQVTINFGDRSFNGFVYSSTKIGRNKYRIECRTNGAKLTEPYSPVEETYDEATTSHDLCALYSSATGVSINITAGNLTFDGSYYRQSTRLGALAKIANITGAEYWDDGSSIQIQPNKAITTDGTEIAPNEIFNFVSDKESIYNKGIGYVTVRNGGEDTGDIVSRNNIHGEVDECTGETFIYPNPYGEIEKTAGLSPLVPIENERKETNSVLDVDLIRLDGAIKEISEVTLNGAVITDYSFVEGHNVIYFTTLKRGLIVVSYTAKGFKCQANISTTVAGRFITFDVFYLDQVLLFQGFLLEECNNNMSTDGDMTCIVPYERYYHKGFDVYTIGGDPEFIFYNRDQVITGGVTSVSENYTSVEHAMLQSDGSGGYKTSTRFPIGTALSAKASGNDISFTTSNDGTYDYFNFTQYYPNVEISYTTPATKHTVQFADIPNGEIYMVIKNKNTDKTCEYEIFGINSDDMNSIPCELNQTIPVNISHILDLDVTAIKGVTLIWTDPNGTIHSEVIDDFGVLGVYVDMDGDYVIDTSEIKNRTSITLTANVNG